MKTLMVTLFLLLSASLAKAETEQLTCNSYGNTTVVSATLQFKGSYEDAIGNDLPVIGTLKIVKFAGKQINRTVALNGTLGYSAKGPYYDTSAQGVEQFLFLHRLQKARRF